MLYWNRYNGFHSVMHSESWICVGKQDFAWTDLDSSQTKRLHTHALCSAGLGVVNLTFFSNTEGVFTPSMLEWITSATMNQALSAGWRLCLAPPPHPHPRGRLRCRLLTVSRRPWTEFPRHRRGKWRRRGLFCLEGLAALWGLRPDHSLDWWPYPLTFEERNGKGNHSKNVEEFVVSSCCIQICYCARNFCLNVTGKWLNGQDSIFHPSKQNKQ